MGDFCDRLEGGMDGSLLGEPSRRRSVLPAPAQPRRPAERRPVPTRPWYVRVLDSIGSDGRAIIFTAALDQD